MKKLIIATFALSLAVAEMGCAGEAYVTEQPAEVVYTRPPAPGPGYVWVDGDWYWSGGRYTRRSGHWAHPRKGHVWVGGHWQHTPRGYHWQKGHWHR